MTANSNLVDLDVSGEIATITLRRPEKLNAIDPVMLRSIGAQLTELDADPAVRVLIVTGEGERAFSAGADIAAWAALEPIEMWRRWIREGHAVLDRLARLRQPTIAALNGFAFGGGLELALACDLRIAASHVELAAPEVKIGTVPGWGGTQRLAAVIGPARAKQMIFTGARVDAATAERWGLINEVTPSQNLSTRANAIAGEIAANAPLAVQLAKQAIDSASGPGHAAAVEAMAGALAATTADGREGIASFREKRPAQFAGK